MSKKTRYLIILLGFLTFIVLAPLLVLYVQGINYNFASRTFTRTGIFAIRTEPTEANIFLNGSLTLKHSGDLKFIKPGEYNVTINKEGFEDWSKRLYIKPNEVTWVNPAPNKIFLFSKAKKPEVLANAVLSFSVVNSTLLFLTPGNLSVGSTENFTNTENYPIAKTVDTIYISPNSSLVILSNSNIISTSTRDTLLFNFKTKSLTDLSLVLGKYSRIFFGPDSSLYTISEQGLNKIDIQNEKSSLLIASVKDCSILNDIFYCITSDSPNQTLNAYQFPGLEKQILIKNIPEFSKSSIFLNNQKQAFVLLDKNLYSVNTTLVKIAENLSDFYLNAQQNTLIIVSGGELSYFNNQSQHFELITRSGLQLKNPRLNLTTGYAFFLKENTVTAIELDKRDHQNQYSFYSGQNPTDFFVDNEAKNLFVLENGNLKKISLRP